MKKIFFALCFLIGSLAGMKDARMTTERITPSQPQTTVPEESPVDRSATTLHDPLMMLAAAAIAVAQDRTNPTPSTAKTTEPSTQPSLAAMLLARQEELLHETPPRYSIECDICHNTFTTGEALERHTAQFHDESNPYDCNICHCRFAANDALKDDVETTHGDTHPHMCRFCYQGFSTLEDLEEHQRHDHASSAASVSEVQEPMAHEAMGDALIPLTTAAAAITTAKRTNHTNAPIVFIDESSSISCYRPLHARVKRIYEAQNAEPFTGEYECIQCNKKFKYKEALWRHIQEVHKHEKSFECDICKRKFTRAEYLRRHKRTIHEHRKDFECVECGIELTSKQGLQKHRKGRHNQALPFDCPLCHQRFATKNQLKKHGLKHKVDSNIIIFGEHTP